MIEYILHERKPDLMQIIAGEKLNLKLNLIPA